MPKIEVNGIEHVVENEVLTYEDAIVLAGYKPHRILTVVFMKAGGKKPEGILIPGRHCWVKDGTRLEVCDTSNA